MDNNNYCMIMAGGVGSRFWPLSRTSKPKQFLDILGTGKSLLQQTFERFSKICPEENIYIVTSKEYEYLVTQQLPRISKKQVLLEPMRRNTAPCIAYANYRIQTLNENANIIVAPSDHLILNENEFIKVATEGLQFVKTSNALLTLGIKPSRIETGYGYIQIHNGKSYGGIPALRKVKTFTEKPEYEMAKVFYESGEFFWNSGIFIWSLKSIMGTFQRYLPEINNLFQDGYGLYNTADEAEFIEKTYSKCKSISIDYGIMEKADNVYVYCADFGWSDLGTWGSLYENSAKDKGNNALTGKNILTFDLKNSIINVPDNKLAVIQGLEDFIVVETDNVLLICKKSEEQQIKHFVNEVKIEKGDKYI